MINYQYSTKLNFPIITFFSTITKVKNYKNFLPWCLDSYEKNHKTCNLTIKEIKLIYPELLTNKFISEFLHSKISNKNHAENMLFNIKSYEGYIKVGFDLIDFSYLSKVYSISDNVILSVTDDSQSHIFKKLESIWILKTSHNSDHQENTIKKFENQENIDKNNHILTKEAIEVQYFINFEMKSFIFSNITSLCMNFLGENIVKSFISETEKILNADKLKKTYKHITESEENSEIRYKKMINFKLQNLLNENNEKLNKKQKENLEILFDLLFLNKNLDYKKSEVLLNNAYYEKNILHNLLFFSEIISKNNINQQNFIASEIQNLVI